MKKTRKPIISEKEIARVEALREFMAPAVVDHLDNLHDIIKKYAAQCEWDDENNWQHRLWGVLDYLVAMGIISKEHEDLLTRYYLFKKGQYMIEKMTGKTA